MFVHTNEKLKTRINNAMKGIFCASERDIVWGWLDERKKSRTNHNCVQLLLKICYEQWMCCTLLFGFSWNFNSTKSTAIKTLRTYPLNTKKADEKNTPTHTHTQGHTFNLSKSWNCLESYTMYMKSGCKRHTKWISTLNVSYEVTEHWTQTFAT